MAIKFLPSRCIPRKYSKTAIKIIKKCEHINPNFKEILEDVGALAKHGNSNYGYEDIPVSEKEATAALKAIKNIALFPEIQKLRMQFALEFPVDAKSISE